MPDVRPVGKPIIADGHWLHHFRICAGSFVAALKPFLTNGALPFSHRERQAILAPQSRERAQTYYRRLWCYVRRSSSIHPRGRAVFINGLVGVGRAVTRKCTISLRRGPSRMTRSGQRFCIAAIEAFEPAVPPAPECGAGGAPPSRRAVRPVIFPSNIQFPPGSR